MKKLLTIMSATGLVVPLPLVVIACGNAKINDDIKVGENFNYSEAIAALQRIMNNTMNTYYNKIKTSLSVQLESPNTEFRFFNKQTLTKLVKDANPSGVMTSLSVGLNTTQESDLQSDLRRIFNINVIKTAVDNALRNDNGSLNVLVGKLNGNIVRSLDFRPTSDGKYDIAITKMANNASVVAYQFQFSFNITYNYLDANGNQAQGTTDRIFTRFNALKNEGLERFVEWSSRILPAQLFNYPASNERDATSGVLHITEQKFGNEEYENVFSNFDRKINSYLSQNLGQSLSASLNHILKNSPNFGFNIRDTNQFSVSTKITLDSKLECSNFDLQYQFGNGVDYQTIQKVRSKNNENASIYSAVLSDPDYLLSSDKMVSSKAKQLLDTASRDYVRLNEDSIVMGSGVHPFRDSEFAQEFDDFGLRYSTSQRIGDLAFISYDNSLSLEEKTNTYAFGTVNFTDVFVKIDGFAGRFALDFVVPWIFSHTKKTRQETFAQFFVTYARFRQKLGIKFFEQVRDIDNPQKRKNAFLTMNFWNDRSLDDGGYNIFQPYNSEDGSTSYLLNIMSSINENDWNTKSTGFRPFFLSNQDAIGFSDLEEFGFRDFQTTNHMFGDAIAKRGNSNNIVALQSNIDYALAHRKKNGLFKVGSGIMLRLKNSLGLLELGFESNENLALPIIVYRADGTTVNIKNPFEWINSYIMAHADLVE